MNEKSRVRQGLFPWRRLMDSIRLQTVRMVSSPDKKLLQRAQAGDSDAFGQVVDLCYEQIFRFAVKYTGHRQDAEDVAQLACIKLATAITSYRFEAAFSSWLYTLVLNCARDWYRQQQRDSRRDVWDGSQSEYGDVPVQGGEESVIYLRQVLAQVQSMGEEFFDTLVLVAGEGLSHKAVADLLGVKESTVSWRIHEIRKRLASARAQEEV